MQTGKTHPNKLDVWGDSMIGKRAAEKRRMKRSASKKRRQLLKREERRG